MPTWLPDLLLFLFGSMLLLTVLYDWWRYGRAARLGLMNRSRLTAYVTADLISVGVGLGFAYFLQRWLAQLADRMGLSLDGLPPFLLYFLSALVLTVLVSKLYHRFIDGPVRAFLATQEDTAS